MLNWISYEQSSLPNSYSSQGLGRVAPLENLQWLSSAGEDGIGQEGCWNEIKFFDLSGDKEN